MPDFKLPDLGEGVTEAEIDRWLVQEGQQVNEDDPLVEVITDKATAEIPSPYSGKVARLHVKEGDIVPVGTVLVTIGETQAAPAALEGTVEALFKPHEEGVPPTVAEVRQPEEPAAEVPQPEDEPAAQPEEPAAQHAQTMPPESEPAAEEEAQQPAALSSEDGGGPAAMLKNGVRSEEPDAARSRTEEAAESAPPAVSPESVKATPPVRKLARDLGVDLAAVTGSGPGGRILREDVEAQVAAPAATAGPALTGTRVPFRGVRRMIAEQMVKAHGAIPPVTHVEECDITELDAARRLANERSQDGTKLTFLPFIVKAVVNALKDNPALNSTLDEEANEIVYQDRYDIGFAVDTPQGLMVPVIRGADSKTVRQLAVEIETLASGARDGALTSDQLRGSTFTITSPGPFGGLMATPIINYPEAAILGVHRAVERPVVRNGQVVVRLMMNFSITFDHRLLDGLTAAKFCMDVVKLLEHPTVLALES
jgi:pyruvate/2-oxoglutarate dehydrogenase complex dihydrolipoamide acyltransferase (E2) component